MVAVGKAALAMASVAERFFGPRIRSGVVVVSAADVLSSPRRVSGTPKAVGTAALPTFQSRLTAFAGGHPTPDEVSVTAGHAALALAQSLGSDEMLLVLLSGGASALMVVPADGLTLEDKQQTTERLLHAGADIARLNAVRKHLSKIKGGWLAASAAGRCRTFAVSDVVDDDLSVIASGPTVPDPSTFADALDVIHRYGGRDAYPRAVVARLEAGVRGEIAETPKPGDKRLGLGVSMVIGGRRDAMDGAAFEAARLGYQVVRIDAPVVGEARTTALLHLEAVMTRASGVARPLCVVSSGETTVRVRGGGRGGRNQEFALALVAPLASLGLTMVAASIGTDGVDGPTDAAGAVVDHTTAERARAAGLETPTGVLDRNDAYPFFEALGDLIRTGPTGTNVGDLQLFLLA